MKIPEHVTLSFLLAQCGAQQQYGWEGTALMIVAGCLPDSDGLSLVGGWRFYQKYHRKLGHGLPMTLGGPFALAAFGAWGLGLGPLLPLWLWLQVALVAHLFTDICFYRWPAQLLWPLSSRGLGFGWLAWNDLVPTLTLYLTAAVALCRPDLGHAAALVAVVSLGVYLVWRGFRPRRRAGLAGWVTGDWAWRAAPYWRWLTGDFTR